MKHKQDYDPRSANDLSELDWLAFRYVASEMSQSDRDQFEDRLATDQSAREAVAAAVELTLTIAGTEGLVEPLVKVAKRAHGVGKWQRMTWIATAVAACLAIVVGYQFVSKLVENADSDHSSFIVREGSPRMDNPLAQAWVQVGDESAELVSFGANLDDLDAEALDDDATDHLEDVSVEAPDWMLSAVSGMSKFPKEGE